MASTFLVVKVVSLGAPQSNQIGYLPLNIPVKFVLAGFDGGAPSQMKPTSDRGVFELQFPAGAKSVEVAVKDSSATLEVDDDVFWAMSQKFKLDTSKSQPTLVFDGSPHVNVRNVTNHTRGTDFAVEVSVCLGHLRDGSAIWPTTLEFSFTPNDVPHMGPPVLDPSGIGPNQISGTITHDLTPRGDILIAERTTIPRMVVVYRPKQFVDLKYPADRPYPYHIFFHPHPTWNTPYPGSFEYGDLAQRYLLQAMRTNRETKKVEDFGKHMSHQQADAGDKMLLVFPVGSHLEGFPTLASQTQVFRLLQEVNYWSQRLDQHLNPVAPIGQIALSGFSFGITAVANIIMGAQNPLFFDKLLKEVYSFDGVFQEPNIGPDGKQKKDKKGNLLTRESEKETAKFLAILKQWFRGGADQRAVRIYTQRSYWFDGVADFDTGATLTNGRPKTNAKELESTGLTALLLPKGKFWTDFNPLKGANDTWRHQEFPARFVGHAIDRSALTPGPPPPPQTGPPHISTPSELQKGAKDKPYRTATLQATGGRSPLTWRIKSGSLPTGMSLSEEGVISGTPTVEGRFSIVVEVTDQNGITDVKGFDLDVISCFIMTAAHGSALNPDIQFLWSLRENVLRNSDWGRQFFAEYWKHYYRISPGIAKEMEADPALRDMIRWSIVEPWTHYMKLLVARPDWDRVDFAALDPSLRSFLEMLRGQMDSWLSQVPLPSSFAGMDPAEAVKELNVALTYVVRTGGAAYLDRLTESGELPLRFEESRRYDLRGLLMGAGRSPAEIAQILGAAPMEP
jgi:hypothetical protein